MKRTLMSAGFLKMGSEWRGTRGKLLSLWISSPDREEIPTAKTNNPRN
ncbi:MAG: hypothetical protein ACREIC_25920 [Limisphaerales bacterium]